MKELVNIPKNIDLGLLILRISIGGMLLIHGISKLVMGIGWLKAMLANMGVPSFAAYGVFIGEVVAPVLLIIGYKSRLAAAVIAINMFVAVAMVHTGDVFALGATGGWSIELPALYFFGALVLCCTGAGRYSVRNWCVAYFK